MQESPPTEADTVRRLRAVEATGLLDTAPEEAFDRLTRMAATLLDAPMAFATIVDERRSFWKSTFGVGDDVRGSAIEDSFCQYVIADRAAVVVDDAVHDERVRDNAAVRDLGVAAWAGFPVRGPGGEVLGSFCVVDVQPRQWTERELEVLGALAESVIAEIALRAALAGERAAREEAETIAVGAGNLARTLQQSLLPPTLPSPPGLDIAARYQPAGSGVEVVGDFYDVFQSGRAAWNVVIGDVSGKGVEAAKLTALAHYTLRAAAMQTDTPSEILGVLNRAMLQQDAGEHRFLTTLYLTFTPDAEHLDLCLCSAGHEQALLKRADGSTSYIGASGVILGAFPDIPLTDTALDLHRGDQLVLYTDGVIDARRGTERFGLERLRALVASADALTADALADVVEQAVLDFNDGPLPDDAAIVTLAATGLAQPST